MPRRYDIDEQGHERDLPIEEPEQPSEPIADPFPRERTQGPEKATPQPDEE